MANQSSTRFDVPKFNDFNYPIWKVRMYVILVKDGYAKGKDKKHKDMTNAQIDKKTRWRLEIFFLHWTTQFCSTCMTDHY